MKIGIVGSRTYQSKMKVKELIFKCKQEFGENLSIVSGGQPKGADGFAKKYALELNVNYREFPPRHYNWNSHCVKDATHYGKPYRPWNFFDRNTEIAEDSDVVFCFVTGGIIENSKGTYDTYQKAINLNKKVQVIS